MKNFKHEAPNTELEHKYYSKLPEILNGKGAENLVKSAHYYELASGDRVVAGTDKGVDYKDYNEDRVVIHPSDNFAAVIDGMGGHYGGELAAEILAKNLLALPGDVVSATVKAKQEMTEQKLGEGGAVFISVEVITQEQKGESITKSLKILQSGDAKLIIIKKDGTISFESQDDSWSQALVEAGQITSDQALYNTRRHQVFNSISSTDEIGPKLYPTIKVETGDIVLLMSDGISDNFTAEEIASRRQKNNLSIEQLFFWLSEATDKRMTNKEEIIRSSNRDSWGIYSDGYKSEPKSDNRALIIMEIK